MEGRAPDRGRTPVRGETTGGAGVPGAAAARARSRSRDVLRNKSGELSVASSTVASRSILNTKAVFSSG